MSCGKTRSRRNQPCVMEFTTQIRPPDQAEGPASAIRLRNLGILIRYLDCDYQMFALWISNEIANMVYLQLGSHGARDLSARNAAVHKDI
jgi:hypothetical protein